MTIPTELVSRPQWVTWRYEKEERPVPKDTEGATKIPYNARTGHKASPTNPNTWTSYDVAVKAAQQRRHSGVGFVFSKDDPFTGIDLDDCLGPDGSLEAWADEIVQTMDSYTEISPSGSGVKIWVIGEIPGAVKTPRIEMYCSARYFTVTGQRFDNTPTTIRNVNGALTDLYEETVKKKDRPTAPRLTARASAVGDEHTQAWARKILARAIEMVTLAADGLKHDTLLDAARLAAGAVPHISEWDIENALVAAIDSRAADKRSARRTIQDGIRMGLSAPLPVPDPPAQPVFDSENFACCPTHQRRLSPSKNGNGYKCRERDTTTTSGWCDFWWKGESYVMPKANEPTIIAGELLTAAPVVAPAVTPTTRFLLYNIDGLRALPPVTWLIENEIPANLTTVICGPSQAGKSFLAVDYAMKVARQYPDRAVVYIAPEGGSGYRQRVDAWLSHHGGDEPQNILFILQTVTLLNPQTLGELVSSIQSFNPIMVIIDTLARALVGGDENSAKDIGLFFYHTDLIREATKAAIVVVHHTGKAGAYRGSSAMYGAVDSWIDFANDDGLITVSCGKAKDWEPFAPRYLRMVKSLSSVVLLSSDQVSRRGSDELTEAQRKVLETLALDIFAEAGAKRAEIASATGVNDLTLFKVLSRMKRDGLINQSKKGDPYFISGDGLTAIKSYHRELRVRRETAEKDLLVGREIDQKNDQLASANSDNSQELANNTSLPDAQLANSQSTSKSRNASYSHQLATSNDLAGIYIPASSLVAKGSEVESNELFPDDDPQDTETLPETPQAPKAPGGLDWDYLRRVYANGDEAAIRRHCQFNRGDFEMVMEQLRAIR